MDTSEHTANNPVKGTLNTFRIIETLQELNGAGVTEIATHLELPKSSVHNYLSTLVQEEYVVKDGQTYHVGLRFLNLGTHARHRCALYDVAPAEVTALAQETGELANLLVEEHGRGIYLYRAAGDEAINVDAHTGYRVYLHNTALGKAMLAHLPPEKVDQVLDRHGLPQTTDHTITDADALAAELAEIRERGVAFDREERIDGIRCVAAPLTSDSGHALGAISLSGPTSRLRDERFEDEFPALLMDAANVIELNLRYA